MDTLKSCSKLKCPNCKIRGSADKIGTTRFKCLICHTEFYLNETTMITFELCCEKENERPSHIEVGREKLKFYIKVAEGHEPSYSIGRVTLDKAELRALRDALSNLL